MTSADCLMSGAAFGAALDAGDFASAGAALEVYLAAVRSGRFGLAEITEARRLIEHGLRTAAERRAVLAQDLSRAWQLQRGYRSRPIANTWEISG
jgi:hypothetical protein